METGHTLLTYVGLIGLTLTLLSTSAGFIWWLSNKFNKIITKFALQDQTLIALTKAISELNTTFTTECKTITSLLTDHSSSCDLDRSQLTAEIKQLNHRVKTLENEK